MKIPCYQIDAFTDEQFSGNPAAVCLLEQWLPEQTMQFIAAENNLSETAFVVETDRGFYIRWFTPSYEVPLCGHGTLAASYVLFNFVRPDSDMLIFHSTSGSLKVTREGDYYCLDFPKLSIHLCEPPVALLKTLSIKPKEVYRYSRYLCVYDTEADVANVKIDSVAARSLDIKMISITAPGDEVDFVSRYFIPGEARFEDPVTGAAHCALVPYWAKQLQKSQFTAKQLSTRGGKINCELQGDRVKLMGQAVLFLQGEISLHADWY